MQNKHELPDWLVEVVKKTQDEYDAADSDYTATSLISPPLVFALQKKYKPEPELADQLQSWVGTAGHNQIEWALKDNPRYIVEERLFRDIVVPDSPTEKKTFRISAQLDLFDKETGEQWDHKFSKLYSFTKVGKDEYEQQLAIQGWLLRYHGYTPTRSYISGFALDWSKTKTAQSEDYPDTLFCPVTFPQWHDEDVETFIRNKIVEKENAKLGNFRVCTPEERWSKPGKFCVMKKGRKSAVRLLDTMEDAELYLKDNKLKKPEHYIVERKGEETRCKWFCDVSQYCTFYQQLKGE